MMNDICGINCAPLVLWERCSHDSIALAGYANAYRTFGASFSRSMRNEQRDQRWKMINLGHRSRLNGQNKPKHQKCKIINLGWIPRNKRIDKPKPPKHQRCKINSLGWSPRRVKESRNPSAKGAWSKTLGKRQSIDHIAKHGSNGKIYRD